MNILELDGRHILELVSENSSAESRRDYFSENGSYLGSNSPGAKPDYFYNFNNYSPLFKPLVFKPAEKAALKAKIKINYFPPYKSFVVEERKRQTLMQARFHPSFTLTDGPADWADLGLYNINDPGL